jgi:hypothetical protein
MKTSLLGDRENERHPRIYELEQEVKRLGQEKQ